MESLIFDRLFLVTVCFVYNAGMPSLFVCSQEELELVGTRLSICALQIGWFTLITPS